MLSDTVTNYHPRAEYLLKNLPKLVTKTPVKAARASKKKKTKPEPDIREFFTDEKPPKKKRASRKTKRKQEADEVDLEEEEEGVEEVEEVEVVASKATKDSVFTKVLAITTGDSL